MSELDFYIKQYNFENLLRTCISGRPIFATQQKILVRVDNYTKKKRKGEQKVTNRRTKMLFP